jgi:hypothetical protein
MPMARMIGAVVTGIVMLGAPWGCGSALSPAGSQCNADNDCAAGLSCLGLASRSGASCSTVVKACSKSCRIDNDCAAVGSNFKCFATCGSAVSGTCGQTE